MRSELFRRLEWFVGRLGKRTAIAWVTAVATLLSATSVGAYRALDDWVLALIASGRGAAVGLRRGTFDLFTFTVGDPADNHRLIDTGVMLPWWTDETLRISFFRPLASLTHVLDERLWPGSPVVMHLHSLGWFVAMLLSAALVYVRLEEGAPVMAGFAFLLFAFDDAHGFLVAWLANRNALIAGTLGFLSIFAHDAWRRSRAPAMGIAAAVAFGAALAAGEIAIGALAYLVAHAVCVETGTRLRRARSILPYLAVVVAWRIGWARAGFGAHGSGAYIDPLADPLGFLAAAPARFVMLVHGQFSAPPADVAVLAPPSHRPLQLTVGCVTIVLVVWLLQPVVRETKARFWALGSLLALLPLAATFPSDRMLLFVGLGAMALLGRLFRGFVADGARGHLRFGPRSIATGLFLLLHAVAEPLALSVRAAQMRIFAAADERASEAIRNDPTIDDKTAVVLAAPTVLFANYIQAENEVRGRHRPRHLYLLAGASSDIEVSRTGPREIVLRPSAGFVYTMLEQHYRAAATDMAPGHTVGLSTMRVEVVERRSDGRPGAVRFTFLEPLERYVFLRWVRDRYVPSALPEPGERMTLPEEDFMKIMLDTVIGRHG
jgi:hypothetical protein